MPLPSGEKLRDSCAACSAATARCPREKPSCSRCSERGIDCLYLVTRKTGRKQRTHHEYGSDSSLLAGLNDTPEVSYTTTGLSLAGSGSFLSLESQQQPYFWNDVGQISGAQYTPTYGMPAMDLEELLGTSPTPSYVTEPFRNDAFVNQGPFQPPASTATQASAAPSSLSKEATRPLYPFQSTSSPSSTAGSTPLADILPSTKQCPKTGKAILAESDCLPTALRLMGRLSSRANDALMIPSLDVLQRLLKDNQDAIKVVSLILCSPSAYDGYVMMLLSLSMSKILGNYIVTARCLYAFDGPSPRLASTRSNSSDSSVDTPPSSETWPIRHSSSVANQVLKLEEAGALLAQQILGDLYEMQNLLVQLGGKLEQEEGSSIRSRHHDQSQQSRTSDPFSSTVMLRVDRELRQRLTSLSLDLTARIQQYWKLTM